MFSPQKLEIHPSTPPRRSLEMKDTNSFLSNLEVRFIYDVHLLSAAGRARISYFESPFQYKIVHIGVYTRPAFQMNSQQPADQEGFYEFASYHLSPIIDLDR
mmetsp:Transcript_4083/g.6134  ORF Transcript_4083/g.6134 Transcript_4083/m.6134 type:complete len:102 (-) Transcript_4083:13-318(-)